MDNAAKALLIAGGTLIAIVVASIGVYLMRNMAQGSERLYKMMDQTEIAEFNEQFMKYDGREDLTMQEVVTIMNLARENNRRNGILSTSDDNYISVEGSVSLGSLSTNIKNYMNGNDRDYENNTKNMLKEYINGDNLEYVNHEDEEPLRRTTFKCKITKNTRTQLVKKIEIEQKDNEHIHP